MASWCPLGNFAKCPKTWIYDTPPRVEPFLFQWKISRHFSKIATQFHNEATILTVGNWQSCHDRGSAAKFCCTHGRNSIKWRQISLVQMYIALGGQVPTIQSIRNRSTPSPPKLVQESNPSEGFLSTKLLGGNKQFFATQCLLKKKTWKSQWKNKSNKLQKYTNTKW